MGRSNPLTPQEIEMLKSRNYDMSKMGVEMPSISREQANAKAPKPQPHVAPSQTSTPQPGQPAAQPAEEHTQPTMDADTANLFQEIKNKKGVAAASVGYIKEIADMLKDPSRSEEAKKKIFEYREFMSQQWEYSPNNMMLIMIQSMMKGRPLSMVGGATTLWPTVGRHVKGGADPYWILKPVPQFYDKQSGKPVSQQRIRGIGMSLTQKLQAEGKNQKEIQKAIDEELNKMFRRSRFVSFTQVPAYDISDTEPIPGWKHPLTGKDAYDPSVFKKWSAPSNQTNTYVEGLTSALEKAMQNHTTIDPVTKQSKPSPIKLDYRDTGEAGGMSSGGYVAINKSAAGAQKFLVLVHEYAHEILIPREERGKPPKLPEGETDKKKIKDFYKHNYKLGEIDAEATAYVVAKFFDLEKFLPNEVVNEANLRYLAGWGAKPEEVFERQTQIQNASHLIVNAIQQNLPGSFREDTQSAAAQQPSGGEPPMAVENSIQTPASSVPRTASVVYFDLLSS
jgi:hypothetical protein